MGVDHTGAAAPISAKDSGISRMTSRGHSKIDALGLVLDSDPRRVTKTGVMQAEPSEN